MSGTEHQAKKQGISEKIWAETLELRKVLELPKHRYAYNFKGRGIIYGCIYLLINKQTNKVYVGLTSQGIETRFKRHIYDAKKGSLLPLHRSIRKYGKDNFSVEEIANAPNIELLKDLEAFWISKLNAANPAYGYNVSTGYDENTANIPDAIFEEAFLMKLEGVDYEKISKKLEVSKGYLYEVLFGIKRPHLKNKFEKKYGKFEVYRKISDQDKFEIFTLHKLDKSIKEIAFTFSTTSTYVRKLLKGEISPEILEHWIKSNPVPQIINPRLLIKEEVFSIYQKVFIEKVSPSDIEGLDYSAVLKLLKGYSYSGYLKEWKDLGHSVSIPMGDNGQFKAEIPMETLLEAFKARESGEMIKDIADHMGITKTWLNQILLGHQRPEVLEAWRDLGKRKLTQKTIAKPASNRVQIEDSLGNIFTSAKEAGDHYKVSSSAILKGIRLDKKVQGVSFKKR